MIEAHTADMVVVAATCAKCGRIQVSSRKVAVYPDSGEIRLECPVCHGLVVRAVGADVWHELVMQGARVMRVRERITWDDLLEFHEHFDAEMKELLR